MKTYLRIFALFALTSLVLPAWAQDGVAINKSGASADASAILDVASEEAGLLMPRLTAAQRAAIAAPPEGLIVYQTNSTPGFYYVKSGVWVSLNEKDLYHNDVNMGAVPIISPNGTFATTGVTATTVSTGVMQINHPNFGVGSTGPVKMVTPYFFQPIAPPSLPADLCQPSFSDCDGSAGNYQFMRSVMVISPPIAGTAVWVNVPPVLPEIRLCQFMGNGANCDDGPGNYNYYGVNTAPTLGACFGGALPIYNNISGIDPGDDFQLALNDNGQGGTASRRTALSVFIDWNHDADFFDADEEVLTLPIQAIPQTTTPSPIFGSKYGPFTVPAGAVTGEGTMRVIATRVDNNTNPCITGAQGSTRDFSFFVSNGAAPSYPAESRVCNVSDQTTTSFYVRCYDDEGTPVNNRVNIVINPN